MSDLICRKCSEPWDLYYLGHEALWDHPGDAAPAPFVEAHEALLLAEDRHYSEHGLSLPGDHHFKHGGEALVKAILVGAGCPSCWYDPSRATNSLADSEEALRHNLFDSGWDGDPAGLL